MNYLKQIRYFWKKAKRHSFSAGEIALYFYLLECSNTADWENPVWEPNGKLQQAIGVSSYNALNKYRNRLQQLGLIKFKSKNGVGAVEYNIYDVEQGTFSKNEEVHEKVREKVCEKVYEEVSEKVDDSVLYNNKQKPKPINNKNNSGFRQKLFSVEGLEEKEIIERQLVPPRPLTQNDAEEFHTHQQTGGVEHTDWHKYISHLRNWLNTRPVKEQQPVFARATGNKKQSALDILRINQLAQNGISHD